MNKNKRRRRKPKFISPTNPLQVPKHAEKAVVVLDASTLQLFGDVSKEAGFSVLKQLPRCCMAHSFALEAVQQCVVVESDGSDYSAAISAIKCMSYSRMLWKEAYIPMMQFSEDEIINSLEDPENASPNADDIARAANSSIVSRGVIRKYVDYTKNHQDECMESFGEMLGDAHNLAIQNGIPFVIDAKSIASGAIMPYLARWYRKNIPHFWGTSSIDTYGYGPRDRLESQDGMFENLEIARELDTLRG